MAYEFQNRIADASLVRTKALPAAAATNLTDVIDLGSALGRHPDFEIEISIPAMAEHSSASYDVVLTVQDSADNDSFANVVPEIIWTFPGVASTGSAATVKRIRLPGVRRYVKILQAVDTGGPTLTAYSITYTPVF